MLIGDITADLEAMHLKIVTVDNLQSIKDRLKNMSAIKRMEIELNAFADELASKANLVEQFMKDLLGGSLYECERRLNEALDLVQKLLKRDAELNNGINEFEQHI